MRSMPQWRVHLILLNVQGDTVAESIAACVMRSLQRVDTVIVLSIRAMRSNANSQRKRACRAAHLRADRLLY